MTNFLKIFSVFAAIVIFAACSGGGGDATPQGSNETLLKTVSGVAAAGAPIVGIVNIKGANGATASSPIELDGSFSVNVDELIAPYILFAEGRVNGREMRIFSSAVAAGTINITPITDFILRNAMKMQAEAAFDNWTVEQVDELALAATESEVQVQLQPLLTAAGITGEVNLLTSPFNADHTLMDAVLDAVSIAYTDTTATVTNTVTGSSFEDDITQSADGACLPPTDLGATTVGLSELEKINQGLDALEALYATAKPSTADLTTWFNTYVADDYFDGGETKTQMFDQWAYGSDEGPAPGFKMVATIEGAYDVTGTGYTKGYKVRFTYTDLLDTESWLDFFVFDGAKWLWYGERTWLDYANDNDISFANMQTSDQGLSTFSTGFELWTEDMSNYAYDQGVRSAIYSGPGLPAGGVVMEHLYPVNRFGIYGQNGGTWYVVADDTVLSGIAANSEYACRLYTETADLVSLAGSTPVQTYTFMSSKRPYLNSELNASLFPILTTPANQNLASLNIGGEISVAWVNSAVALIHNVQLSWSDAANTWQQVESEAAIGSTVATSVVLDTIGLNATNGWAYLRMWGDFKDGRQVTAAWAFSDTAPATAGGGSTVTTPASSIVGSWGMGYDAASGEVIEATFYSDNTYIFYQKGVVPPAPDPDSCGAVGVEYGTYSYDSTTGKLTASPAVDNTGCWGLSDPIQGWFDIGVIDANHVTLYEGQTDGLDQLTRIVDAANPIVGSWGTGYFPNGTSGIGSPEYMALTFYANGTYFHYETGQAEETCDNGGGVEYGTFNYDGINLSFVPIVDDNGCVGLAENGVPASYPLVFSGDALTFSDAESFPRVDAL
jgi:hypothetical protein